jgi:alpha-galactosidase
MKNNNVLRGANLKYVLFIFLMSFTFSSFAQEVSYEAESGTRANGAQIQSCGSCSGSNNVGYLGGTSNGSVTLSINITTAGAYNLKIFYASGDPRDLVYTINGSATTVACPASGGWSTVANLTRQVYLVGGTNTIKFDNSAGWAPNLDRFTVAPAIISVESESGTRTNGANVQTCGACSGGQLVGNLGGTTNGTVTHTVNAAATGSYNLVVSYATADPRTIYVTVNAGMWVGLDCTASGGWTTVATATMSVNLNAGNNTIKFDNGGGWAPNLDKFTLWQTSPVYAINGVITENGVAAPGITLNLSGQSSGSTTTNSSGAYQFSNLPTGNYTVTPSKTGYSFTPANRSYSLLNSNQSAQNFTAACSGCTSMSYGSNGRVDYNLLTGNYNVYSNNVKIISDAYALVKNGATNISSRDYASRTSSQTAISDGFGSGTKYTITLTGNGLPQMQQMFYIYPSKGYFLTEVLLSGTSVTSNYMAPLISNSVNIQSAGDNRVIFSPFDNDTFIRYDARSMNSSLTSTSSEVTAVYENGSRNGLVAGSVEHMVWKTGVKTIGAANVLSELTVWGGYTETGVTRDNRVHGSITGASVKSPRILVGYYSDWRNGMEDYGKAVRIMEPPYVFDWTGATPFGWNSWGSIQSNINLTNSKAVVDFFANNFTGFRNGNTAYIDLDSYWDNMSGGGLTGDFSQLTEFANYCKSKGLKPGIYWAPFVDWGKTSRTIEGSSYNYTQAWTRVNGGYHDLDGCRAMDPTHPGTQERLAYVIGKFKSCGFEMIKIDFVGHAAIEGDSFYDTSVKTGMQAYRKGMEYLVNQLAGQMLVYVAISPNLGTNRYVHMRRIACDAYSAIGETQYTLNSTNNGWWLTYAYDYIDADHMVMGTQSLGANRARALSGVITGTLITGDNFSASGQWIGRAQTLFQNQEVLDIARNGVAFMPIEGNNGNQASELFGRQIGNYYYLAVFNYGSSSKNFNVSFSRFGLGGSYTVKELFSGTTSTMTNSLNVNLPAADAAIYRFTLTGGRKDVHVGDSGEGVYPNPAKGIVHLNQEGLISVTAIDEVSGKSEDLSFESNDEKSHRLDVSRLKRGIYILKIVDRMGEVKNVRLVKE